MIFFSIWKAYVRFRISFKPPEMKKFVGPGNEYIKFSYLFWLASRRCRSIKYYNVRTDVRSQHLLSPLPDCVFVFFSHVCGESPSFYRFGIECAYKETGRMMTQAFEKPDVTVDYFKCSGISGMHGTSWKIFPSIDQALSVNPYNWSSYYYSRRD